MGEERTGRRPGRGVVLIVGEARAHQRHRGLDPAAPRLRRSSASRAAAWTRRWKLSASPVDLDQRVTAERRDQPVQTERLGNSRAEFLRQSLVVLGKQTPRNRLGRQESAEAQQIDGQRLPWRAADRSPWSCRPSRDSPREAFRQPTARFDGCGRDRDSRRDHSGLAHVGGRLRERERQVAELLGDRICRVAVGLPGLVEQKPDRGVAARAPARRAAARAASRVARGDQHPAAASLGRRLVSLGPGRVVEHEQPAVPARERLRTASATAARSPSPAFASRAARRARRSPRAASPAPRRAATRRDRSRRRERRRIRARAGSCRRRPCPHGGERDAAVRELHVQLIEQRIPPGEVRVAQKRHVPDGRQALASTSPAASPSAGGDGRTKGGLGASQRLSGCRARRP